MFNKRARHFSCVHQKQVSLFVFLTMSDLKRAREPDEYELEYPNKKFKTSNHELGEMLWIDDLIFVIASKIFDILDLKPLLSFALASKRYFAFLTNLRKVVY